MPEYIDLPDDSVTPEVIFRQMFADLSSRIPGWLPSEGNLEVALMEAFALQVSEVRRLQTQVPIAIFQYFGETIVGLPRITAIAAIVRSTWTLRDTDGYIIPAGALVGLGATGSDTHQFAVRDSVTVVPGQLTTLPSEVILESVNLGPEPNGIASGSAADLIETLPFVDSIVTTEAVAGGVAAETLRQYLDRLADQFALFSPRAIVPGDFEALARSVPGVSRAIAVNGYNPTTMMSDQEKTILVSVIAADGSDVPAETLVAVDTLLQSEREVNFVVNVVAPTRTEINVTIVGIAYPEWALADVEAGVRLSIADFLSPALWGLPRFGDRLLWIDERTVRQLDLVTAVGNTEGLHYATSVQLSIEGGNLGEADLALVGIPSLPTTHTIDVTITHA